MGRDGDTADQRPVDGYWAADVPGISPGAEYRFRIVNGDASFERRDPYGRALSDDSSASVVTQRVAMPRESKTYHTPAWNEMVIYELHIGTFNPAEGKFRARLMTPSRVLITCVI